MKTIIKSKYLALYCIVVNIICASIVYSTPTPQQGAAHSILYIPCDTADCKRINIQTTAGFYPSQMLSDSNHGIIINRIQNHEKLIEPYAINNDASKLTTALLKSVGVRNVEDNNLFPYQMAIANQPSIDNLTYLQTLIDTVNTIKKYTITAKAIGNGTIEPSGKIVLYEGSDQAFKILSDTGYDIDTLTIDDLTIVPVNEYSFMDVRSNHRIEVVFKQVSAPVAKFSASPTDGNLPLEVIFKDHSVNKITSWLWDFGDGSFSSSVNPKHTYFSSGLYSVKLTVTGPGGMDEYVRTQFIQVNDDKKLDFFAQLTSGHPPLNVHFISEIIGNYDQLTWSFGDGYTSTLENPDHLYQKSGRYTVKLTVAADDATVSKVKNNYIDVLGTNISGRVIAEDTNEGLGSYIVEVWKKNEQILVGMTYTNQWGYYTFQCNESDTNCIPPQYNEIPSSNDLILVASPPFMNHAYYPQYYKGQDSQDKATLLSTTDSHLENIDIEMKKSSHSGITGIVHNDSQPLSDRQVDIYSQSLDFGLSTMTDENGMYTFIGLKTASDYKVSTWDDNLKKEFFYAIPEHEICGQFKPDDSAMAWENVTPVKP